MLEELGVPRAEYELEICGGEYRIAVRFNISSLVPKQVHVFTSLRRFASNKYEAAEDTACSLAITYLE